MSEQDYWEYREARSGPRSPPRAISSVSGMSMDSQSGSGRQTPALHPESRSVAEGDVRPSRVGDIILQAVQQAQQVEQAQATAKTAAQIAAQARKMRSRTKRVQPAEEPPEADLYDMESGMRGPPGVPLGMGGMDSEDPGYDGVYTQPEKDSSTAKDIRGQNNFSYDGKAYNLPLPPAFALLDIGKPGRQLKQRPSLFKGPLVYRLCLWTAIVLMVVSVALAIALLTAFLALEPQQPTYELEEIRIQWWTTYKDTKGEMSQSVINGTARPTVYLYADAIMVTKADNPNQNLILHYDNTTFEVSYQGVSIGSASVPPLIQPPKNSTEVTVEWKCNACAVLNVGHYLEADEEMGAVPLQIKMTVDARVEVAGVLSPGYVYSTTYDVKVKPPRTASR